jgi:ATP-dependent helicase/nuclease subunit A
MNATIAPADASIQQRRATLPDRSVWVSASAGTGKTKVLTDRVLSLLLAGTAPGRILCLTFTRAAAAEMSNRINGSLGDWAAADEDALTAQLTELLGHTPDGETFELARRLFAEVLEVPGRMKIQTIHAFCESVLKRFPLEAGLAPHFEVMDERSAAEELAAVRDEVLRHARHGDDDALADALAEVTSWIGEQDFAGLFESLTRARGRLARLIAAHDGADGFEAAIHRELGVREDDTDEDIVAAACADEAFIGDDLRAAAEALAGGSKTDIERGNLIAGWLDDASLRPAAFDDYAHAFLTNDLAPRKRLITKPAADAVADTLPQVKDILQGEAERLVAVVASRDALVVAVATAALIRLADGLLHAFDGHKRAHGLLDYDDLILGARRLLEQDGGASWVLYKLDGGVDHILIDEAQDTNPDQWAVVQALAEEFFSGAGAAANAGDAPRTVFAVGDRKQSIYGFQRADPDMFEAMRAHFRDRAAQIGQALEPVELHVSFRSTPSVLKAVDAVFAADGVRDGVAPQGEEIRHVAHRDRDAGLVELWPAVEPGAAVDPEPWAPPALKPGADSPPARLARVIAGRIKRWLAEGEILQSRARPIRAGDVIVLVRRRTEFVEHLVRALKQLEVPVAGIDRMVLSDQLPVMDLIALGEFLLLPEDDLNLATVLKGPLFGLDEPALFDLAYGRDDASLWSVLRRHAGADQRLGLIEAELSALLAKADFVPPYELYAEILGRRGARRKILGRLGFEAGDPLDEFLAQALAYQRSHPPSLQGFLHWIGAGDVEIKRDLEQTVRDEVRVMTVHGAKGLQAPIVFLPDTMQVPRADRFPILWRDETMAFWPPRRRHGVAASEALHEDAARRRDQEYRRLLYVAMTRAEDRLYVCGWQTRNTPPEGCWYDLVRDALEPLAASFDCDLTGDAAVGWRGTGWRIENPQAGKPEEPHESLRFAIAPARLPEWAMRPAPEEETPPRPLAPSRGDPDTPASCSPLKAPGGRVGDGGKAIRRGLLVHDLLQTLPDMDPARRRQAADKFLARKVHGLTRAEQAALAGETLTVLEHREFAPIFGAGSRAEVPVSACIDGRVIAGQIDRLIVTDEAVWIVDYKTGRQVPERAADTPPAYLRQMAAYRAVLERIYPGRAVRCALLWTDAPALMPLDDESLARWVP